MKKKLRTSQSVKSRSLFILISWLAFATNAFSQMGGTAYKYVVDEESNYRMFFVPLENNEAMLVGTEWGDLSKFTKTTLEVPSTVILGNDTEARTVVDIRTDLCKNWSLNYIRIPSSVTSFTLPHTLKRLRWLQISGKVIDELRIPSSIKYDHELSETDNYIRIYGNYRNLIFEDGCEIVGGWGLNDYLEHVTLPRTFIKFDVATREWNDLEEYTIPEECIYWAGFPSSKLRTLYMPAPLYGENGHGTISYDFLQQLPNLENVIVGFEKPIYATNGPYGSTQKFFGVNGSVPENLTLWVPKGSGQRFKNSGKGSWREFPRIYEGRPGAPFRMLYNNEEFEQTINGITYKFRTVQTNPDKVGEGGYMECCMVKHVSGDLPEHYWLPEFLQDDLIRTYYSNGRPIDVFFKLRISKYGDYQFDADLENLNDYTYSHPFDDYDYEKVQNIKKVTLGVNTPTIDNGTFYRFEGITTVTVNCPKPTELPSGAFYYKVYDNATLNAGAGRVKAYSETEGWNSFTHIRGAASGNIWEFYDKNSQRSYYGYNRPGGGYGLGNGYSPAYNQKNIVIAMQKAQRADTANIEEPEGTERLRLPSSTDVLVNDAYTRGEFSALNDSLFYEDHTLQAVVLPLKTDSIGIAAFEGCKSLKDIGFAGDDNIEALPKLGDNAFKDTREGLRFWVPLGQLKEFAGNPDYQDIQLIGGYLNTWGDFDVSGGAFSSLLDNGTELGYYYQPQEQANARATTEGYLTRATSRIPGVHLYKHYNMITGTALNIDVEGDIVLPETVIGNPVVGMDAGAFSFATKLTGITMPASMKTIGASVFNGCTALTKVVMLGATPPEVANNNAFDYDTYYNATLWVPDGARDAYAATYPWYYFSNIKEGEPTSINNVLLNDNTQIVADDAPAYNLAGQRVGKSYRGVVIKNRRAVIQK